ncbi:period circadian protein homolog 3 isoform X2 [Erpetoichthys calabaricus]|uniref:period circadian protein homolog 3 isoform X2 n=1 Tax=Erpetoichthys calabaricus TaxID=27687 RepID=UPI002233E717|nr:period circadian protein homolog 3 isoform X2 [Erpetoichthys calabaricus]
MIESCHLQGLGQKEEGGPAVNCSLSQYSAQDADTHTQKEDASNNEGSGHESSSTKSSCATNHKKRDKSHKQMLETVQEMKKRIPPDKKSRSKTSTLEALHHALRCVKQVQANSKHYEQLMSEKLQAQVVASLHTIEDLETIASEHTLENTDTFVVVTSLTTGKVIYISEQATSMLGCKLKFLQSARFLELLFLHDVNVFYSYTSRLDLPTWCSGSDKDTALFQSSKVKSFFCRIRAGRDWDGDIRYSPFRMTPYLLKVSLPDEPEGHLCCLLLAEKILSGYEAPRIPTDKRIFTTTHSPSCMFQEVDERAVPLLGYLPQDLIGTSILSYLHPDDRPLMLSVHRKVLQFAGQPPFDHSPIRFRTQNGDFISLDTSWSSFVNPWSRKVAFIIGRHKVRAGPLNEDVFSSLGKEHVPRVDGDIWELQSQIHKLLMQPVHNNGSSGYGSLGSNGSHEHYVTSSSDSNGNPWDETSREQTSMKKKLMSSRDLHLCADSTNINQGSDTPITRVYATEVFGNGQDRDLLPSSQEVPMKQQQQHVPSYQQINCVDSIIRYLESCSLPTLKRKCESSSLATSSSSEEDNPAEVRQQEVQSSESVALLPSVVPDSQVSVGSEMTTDVHTTAAVVGAPLTDLTVSTKAMSMVSVTSQCSFSSTIVHVPQPESAAAALEDAAVSNEQLDMTSKPSYASPILTLPLEEFRKVGLTKEVLSAHTQKEEQDYVDRFRHHIMLSPYSSYLQRGDSSRAGSQHPGDYSSLPTSTFGWWKGKANKLKQKCPKDQVSSDSIHPLPSGTHHCTSTTPAPHHSWLSSHSSHTSSSVMGFSPPLVQPTHAACSMQPQVIPIPVGPGMPSVNLTISASSVPPGGVPCNMPTYSVPCATPIMAVIYPYYTVYPQAVNAVAPLPTPPFYPTVPMSQPVLFSPSFQGTLPSCPIVQPQPTTKAVPQCHSPSYLSAPVSPVTCPVPSEVPPPLFSNSRSSSPLQLNLLQEELPKPVEQSPEETKCGEAGIASDNHDNMSSSSELLDLLLHEDAQSGTGSNASGSRSGDSLGSGSNGTSASHTGSSHTINTSKYFASKDSSVTSHKGQKCLESKEVKEFAVCSRSTVWKVSEEALMTYQIPTRDKAQVLKEDLDKLLTLQSSQPWFSEAQKEELAEVHPWIRNHAVPQQINTQGCVNCGTGTEGSSCPDQQNSLSGDTRESEDRSLGSGKTAII